MILDSLVEFADATAINTGGAASYLVGNVVDLQQIGRDIGAGGAPLYLVISVDTAFASATGTAAFSLCSDAQAAIAVDGTQTVHILTVAALAAVYVAGYQIVKPLPPDKPTYERYLGIVQTTATAAFTAGKINAFLTMDPQVWKAYPDAL